MALEQSKVAEEMQEVFRKGCNHWMEILIRCMGNDTMALDLGRHGTEDGVAVFEAYCREHNNTPKPHIEAIPHDEHFRRPEDCPMNVKTGASWAETH